MPGPLVAANIDVTRPHGLRRSLRRTARPGRRGARPTVLQLAQAAISEADRRAPQELSSRPRVRKLFPGDSRRTPALTKVAVRPTISLPRDPGRSGYDAT
jgi:hypothetical protein